MSPGYSSADGVTFRVACDDCGYIARSFAEYKVHVAKHSSADPGAWRDQALQARVARVRAKKEAAWRKKAAQALTEQAHAKKARAEARAAAAAAKPKPKQKRLRAAAVKPRPAPLPANVPARPAQHLPAAPVEATPVVTAATRAPTQPKQRRAMPTLAGVLQSWVGSRTHGARDDRLSVQWGTDELLLRVRRHPVLRVDVRDGPALQVFEPAVAEEVAAHMMDRLGIDASRIADLEIDGDPFEVFVARRRLRQPRDDVAASESHGSSVARPGPEAPEDALLGSPRSAPELNEWLTALPQRGDRAPAPSQPEPVRWRAGRGERLNVSSIPEVLGSESELLGGGGPGAAIAAVLRSGNPFLLGARVAEALFDGEEVPAEWLSDIRVPLRVAHVFFSTWFEFAKPELSALPALRKTSPDVAAYRSPLRKARHGAAWMGVTLLAGPGDVLRDEVVFHIARISGGEAVEAFAVPGRMSRSALRPLVMRVAAYTSTLRPQRPPARSGASILGSARRPQSPSGEWPPILIESSRESATRSIRLERSRSRVAPHLRRGHWRRVRVGPRHAWRYELRWIAPTSVGATDESEDLRRVYVVPSLPTQV